MLQACLYVRAACPGAVSTTRHSPPRLHKVAISPQFSSAQTSIPFTSVSFYSFFYMSNQAAVLQYTLIVRCTFSLTGLVIIYGPMSFCVQYSVFHSFISKFYVGWGLCFYVRGGPLFLQCDICLNEQSISEVLTSTATLVSAWADVGVVPSPPTISWRVSLECVVVRMMTLHEISQVILNGHLTFRENHCFPIVLMRMLFFYRQQIRCSSG